MFNKHTPLVMGSKKQESSFLNCSLFAGLFTLALQVEKKNGDIVTLISNFKLYVLVFLFCLHEPLFLACLWPF